MGFGIDKFKAAVSSGLSLSKAQKAAQRPAMHGKSMSSQANAGQSHSDGFSPGKQAPTKSKQKAKDLLDGARSFARPAAANIRQAYADIKSNVQGRKEAKAAAAKEQTQATPAPEPSAWERRINREMGRDENYVQGAYKKDYSGQYGEERAAQHAQAQQRNHAENEAYASGGFRAVAREGRQPAQAPLAPNGAPRPRFEGDDYEDRMRQHQTVQDRAGLANADAANGGQYWKR